MSLEIFSGYTSASRHHDFNIDVDELNEHSAKATQPQGVKINLKPHQLTLLQRCIEYEQSPLKVKDFKSVTACADENDTIDTRVGIIGDRYGAGKSYVILSLIMSNKLEDNRGIITRSFACDKVTFNIKPKKTNESINTNILVIPHNIVLQWENYIQSFNPDMKYIMVNKKAYESLLENPQKIKEYDLLVVSTTYYTRTANILQANNYKVQRIIYDEVDSLNIPGCKVVDSHFYWFVTASYGNTLYPRGYTKWEPSLGRYIWYANGIPNSGFIKNVLLELSNFVPISLHKLLVVKNHEGFVEKSLRLPDLYSHIIKCKTPIAINVLNGIVDKTIINFLNAGDVEGALMHINPKNKSSMDNIISLLIEKYNVELKNLQLKREMIEGYIFEAETERQSKLLKLKQKEDEIHARINMIKERVKGNNMCSICYDDIENQTIVPCCQNSFCFKCIHLWINNKAVCPMCKSKIVADKLLVVDNKALDDPNFTDNQEDSACGSDEEIHECNDKVKNFEILMSKRAPNSKFLIFSNYDNTLNNIIPILNNLHIRYEFLKGNASQINCTLNRYKQGNVDILLVNSRYYGSGMNIENTTDIIMMHKFDTEIEKQVIGRAHRLGRTSPLNVWYFLYENEMK